MRDMEWIELTDAERGQLVSIWMLAADREGVIPASAAIIKKLCFLDTEPDLERFINLGFIEHDDSMASARRQDDADMTAQNRKEENRTRERDAKFAQFWEAHPKKKNKGQAEKAWAKISPDIYEKILTALEVAKKSRDWLKDDGKWIPYPASWLNAKGWEDEYQTTAEPYYESEAARIAAECKPDDGEEWLELMACD